MKTLDLPRIRLAKHSELRVPTRGSAVGDDLIDFTLRDLPPRGQDGLRNLMILSATFGRPLPFASLEGSARVHATGLIQRGLATITPEGDLRPTKDRK